MKYYLKIALQHLAMGLIIPISVIWKLQSGLTLPEAIITESMVLFATAVADLPAGFIANKINNRRSLLIGAFLHLVGMLLLVVGSSFLIFALAAIITGTAWAFVSGADEAYIHDDFIENKDEYKKVFATSNIVDESTTIAGMLGSSLLIILGFDLRILFVVASFILLLHFLYSCFFLPKSQRLSGVHPSLAAKSLGAHLIRKKELTLLVPIMIAFAVVYEAGRPLWQPHMQQIGIDIASFGLIFAILKFASLGGSIWARYRDFHTKDLVFIFSVMLMALLCFGVSIKAISVTALCLYLFTENYFRVYMSTVLNKLITSNRAALLSLGSVIRNATGALLIAGAGILSDVSIFIALLAIVIIKIPAIIYIVRLNSRPSPLHS